MVKLIHLIGRYVVYEFVAVADSLVVWSPDSAI